MSYLHNSGSSAATQVVPEYREVREISCVPDTGGGTIIITPPGGSALDTITIPDTVSGYVKRFSANLSAREAKITAGYTITFAGVTAWEVWYL